MKRLGFREARPLELGFNALIAIGYPMELKQQMGKQGGRRLVRGINSAIGSELVRYKLLEDSSSQAAS